MKKIVVILAVIVLMTAGCVAVIGIYELGNSKKVTSINTLDEEDDTPIETIDPICWDYSQNDLLKTIASRLDLKGGTVTDNNNRQFMITQAHKVELYQDLIIAYNSDLGEYYVFDIHDIRFIRVN